MHALDREIAAFEAQEAELRAKYLGKFVIFCGAQLAGAYDTFDAAFGFASANFGDTPYLIRQVGMDSSFPLPASVAFRPVYAHR